MSSVVRLAVQHQQVPNDGQLLLGPSDASGSQAKILVAGRKGVDNSNGRGTSITSSNNDGGQTSPIRQYDGPILIKYNYFDHDGSRHEQPLFGANSHPNSHLHSHSHSHPISSQPPSSPSVLSVSSSSVSPSSSSVSPILFPSSSSSEHHHHHPNGQATGDHYGGSTTINNNNNITGGDHPNSNNTSNNELASRRRYNSSSYESRCLRCKLTVYQMDKVGPLKDFTFYHHNCFKCYLCGTKLTLKTYFNNQQNQDDQEVYCQSHCPKTGPGRLDNQSVGIRAALNAPKVFEMPCGWAPFALAADGGSESGQLPGPHPHTQMIMINNNSQHQHHHSNYPALMVGPLSPSCPNSGGKDFGGQVVVMSEATNNNNNNNNNPNRLSPTTRGPQVDSRSLHIQHGLQQTKLQSIYKSSQIDKKINAFLNQRLEYLEPKQKLLEMKHRKEEDALYREFELKRREEERSISEQIKEEWQSELGKLIAKYQSRLNKLTPNSEPNLHSTLAASIASTKQRLQQQLQLDQSRQHNTNNNHNHNNNNNNNNHNLNQMANHQAMAGHPAISEEQLIDLERLNLEKSMTLKLDKKKETLSRRLKELERQATAELVEKQSKEMLTLISQRLSEYREEKRRQGISDELIDSIQCLTLADPINEPDDVGDLSPTTINNSNHIVQPLPPVNPADSSAINRSSSKTRESQLTSKSSSSHHHRNKDKSTSGSVGSHHSSSSSSSSSEIGSMSGESSSNRRQYTITNSNTTTSGRPHNHHLTMSSAKQTTLNRKHWAKIVGAKAIVHTNDQPGQLPPAPAPPLVSKLELYSDPKEVFAELDELAINVAKEDQQTFTDLVHHLTRNCLTDVEKARAIFRWITVRNLNTMHFDSSVKPDTPLGLLRGIKNGSESYHVLFKRLCSYAGLHCVVIKGYSKSAGYQPGVRFEDNRFRNSWNAVYVAGAWRFVQCNWGARHLVSVATMRDRGQLVSHQQHSSSASSGGSSSSSPMSVSPTSAQHQHGRSASKLSSSNRHHHHQHGHHGGHYAPSLGHSQNHHNMHHHHHPPALIQANSNQLVGDHLPLVNGHPTHHQHAYSLSSTSTSNTTSNNNSTSQANNNSDSLRYEYDDHYFLTDPEEFIYEFFPLQPEWQLLKRPISLREFEQLPFVRSLFFRYGLYFPQENIRSVLYTDDSGATTIKIGMPNHMIPSLIFHCNLKFHPDHNQHHHNQRHHHQRKEESFGAINAVTGDQGDQFEGVSLKRFVMQSVESNSIVSFRVHLPTNGQYILDIFANSTTPKQYITGEPMKFKSVCKFKIVAKDLKTVMIPLPDCASGEYGPMKATRLFGLIPITHDNGLILVTNQRQLEIQFRMTRPMMDFMASLHKNGYDEKKLADLVQSHVDGHIVTFYVSFFEDGQYGLDIYTRDITTNVGESVRTSGGLPSPLSDQHSVTNNNNSSHHRQHHRHNMKQLLTHCCKYLINVKSMPVNPMLGPPL